MEFKGSTYLRLAAVAVVMLMVAACGNDHDYSPKPRGFYRINFPKRAYQEYDGGCPFMFTYPTYGKLEPDKARNAQPCWMNMQMPDFNGTLHISYQPISSKKIFNELVEDARTFAFKHTVKATSIDEGIIHYPDRKVYGIYYTIDGNAASSAQFFLTDSVKNYVRGALYFNSEPRLDSIQPVLDFVKKDVDVMIKSFRWKGK
ncbi:gliding motility lipoprotein GldD [Mucilaginibacter sp. RS28]|uniref:Gliding motility lipoprotein GldD n=1 Tax=Mucilaginibacter straminoryzae TaxID=2932774 RepID=A0A9X2BAK0_9SPHI|nr:gliding motility lipoprotein GldD [Mucilaginibacter straminoryzae]MCJ8210885.1 gliding motility lipoprotein GldD [Mucilaginibacter straminoryzae]